MILPTPRSLAVSSFPFSLLLLVLFVAKSHCDWSAPVFQLVPACSQTQSPPVAVENCSVARSFESFGSPANAFNAADGSWSRCGGVEVLPDHALADHGKGSRCSKDRTDNGKESPFSGARGIFNLKDQEQVAGGFSTPAGGDRSNSRLHVAGQVSDEIIVRFSAYRHASEHRGALEKSLKGGGWEWVDRINPASAFPTDFALLKIQEAARERVQKQLTGLSFVKDFYPQSRFVRAVMANFQTVEKDVRSDPEWVTGNTAAAGDYRHGDEDMAQADWSRSAFQQESSTDWSSSEEGKRFTFWTQEGDNSGLLENVSSLNAGRKLLLQRSQITSMFGAERLWAKGFTGAKVRMAVFDTGVRADHPHFRNIKERTNWTNEDTLNDNLGHGTFVAGVISSQDPQCLGFAPDAEIFAFRVFTDAQVSYTSWFLDAFNYAIATDMNILNLSIGGPDYLDRPFIEKVWEMTANNIIMVSAIGNDGPLYGTLNNPADQSDVIGVGGIDYSDHIASFSSRGMTTWEIPHGYGRVKPDIVAYGRDIIGSKISTGCKSLSGTSVASPVVAGAVCLLASVIPETIRWNLINPASMKQALVEGAARLNGPNMFEQGAGRLDLLESYEILMKYEPRASIFPSAIDFLDCPYMWPFCRQPLYAGAMPIIFNATILNGMGLVGYIENTPIWKPFDEAGGLLDIRFTYSDVIWPWTGFLGLHLQIREEGADFSGVIEGNVSLSVVSPSGRGKPWQRSECTVHVRVNVIPTPKRELRILWDQFHNVRYPPGYIPRDSLDVRNDILDWHGDHPHTNFHGMFDMLRDAGFYLEILGSPLTCFDARQYGTLLMVDLEDEYHEEEIKKIEDDVKLLGLGLIVFADWYHVEMMTKMKFFDDNTRSWWMPITGGANIPALNDLLFPFGIAFGGTILNGPYSVNGERGFFASGTDIARFPAGGFLHRFMFQDSTKGRSGVSLSQTSLQTQVEGAVLGAVEVGKGRIAVFGDSNCLDSSHMVINCYWLIRKLLEFTSYDSRDPVIFAPSKQVTGIIGPEGPLPSRRDDVNFSTYSSVLGHELRCGNDARFEVQGSKGFIIPPQSPFRQRQPMGRNSHGHDPSSLSLSFDVPQIMQLHIPRADSGRNSIFIPEFQRSGTEPIQTAVRESREEKILTILDTDLKVKDKLVEPQKMGKGGSSRKQHQNIGLNFGWLNHDELDSSTLLAVQWLIPVLLCIAGFVLIFGLWRMQQKRRKRARKGSARSLLTS